MMTKDRKHVLILITDAGLGHRNAARAVAQALRLSYGEAVSVDIVNILEGQQVPAILREGPSSYDKVISDNAELYALGFKISDADVPASLMKIAVAGMLFGVVRDLVQEHKPDAIVVTHPWGQIPLSAVYSIEGYRVPSMTVVTDLVTIHQLWFDTTVDLCVVPTEAARELALEHGLSEDQVAVIGIPVDPAIAQVSKDKAEMRVDLGWRPDMKTLLAVGGKRVDHLQQVLHAVNHANLSLQLVAVAGGDEALYQQFKDTEWHGVTHVYNFVENLPEMMLAADAILCKAGGLIITESLACGLPLLLVDILPGQEQGNADYVVEHNAGVVAESPMSALETLYHWFEEDKQHLREKARCARQLGRPRAAYDIADEVWALIGENRACA